uniref:FolateBiopterin Transporter (FBT) Family putative n=1 Tax=Albugo laibachii Nc14 TaxID=890382 RepID=F0WEC4_9STRA|nr:FolateBiopterin Transporter (FBT) Family putative [Albugo laibachii Nc14]|eukprot:CCA19555.1 FolateBiopterin Transporter (FBT) Family putative [Albugo laibachii Nc14]
MSNIQKNSIDQISFNGGPQVSYDPILGTYNNVNSPDRTSVRSSDVYHMETGSIRPGKLVQIFSRGGIGVLYQEAVVGLLHGGIPAIVVPFYMYYLNTESIVAVAAISLVNIPWSLKIIFGMLTDNIPILGYRRRPMMLIGWIICGTALLVASLRTMPQPYYPDPSWRAIKPDDYTDTIKSSLNREAKNQGGVYTILLCIASFGYVFVDSVVEAVLIEYAQCEPHALRGRLQASCTFVRSLFVTVTYVLVAFGLNSADYGGSFSFGISFSNVLLLLALFVLSAIPMAWIMIHEEIFLAIDFREYIGNIWDSLKSRVFYQVIAFGFLSSMLLSMDNAASDAILMYWMKLPPLSISILSLLANFTMLAGIFICGKYGLLWSWRKLVVFTVVIVAVVDVLYAMPVCFNVIRGIWFLYVRMAIQGVALGMHFMTTLFVVVEVCKEGAEGTCSGLLATAFNTGPPLAATFTKIMSSWFSVRNEDIQNDSSATRRDSAILFLIASAFKIISLALLPLLPRQKAETQALKNRGGCKAMGIFTIAYLLVAWVWSITLHFLNMFESTRCLAIAGGCST